jgi:hypothetical protein
LKEEEVVVQGCFFFFWSIGYLENRRDLSERRKTFCVGIAVFLLLPSNRNCIAEGPIKVPDV